MISIVITLFNKARYIERAIRSVLDQTYQDFEIIVINDGSTDDGGDRTRRINDRRIRVIDQPNKGVGAARNRGVKEAQGELIVMLDGDDRWLPGFLAAIKSLAERYPAAGIYATGYRKVIAENFQIDTSLVPQFGPQIILDDFFRKARIANFVWSSAQAISRRIYEKIGGFAEDCSSGEDLDMWGRIAFEHSVAYDCRVLAEYRSDAVGRLSSGIKNGPSFPPLIASAQRAIRKGEIKPDRIGQLYSYLNRLLIDYLVGIIATGNRAELRRVLASEFYPSRYLRGWIALLEIAGFILPINTISRCIRILLSRWTFVLVPVQVRSGVVLRAIRPK